ncbi:winged helix-turn-helix transcriptional regulator [Chitinophaga vietnamensis]|uniref:winged helix-turn-helix transcriptional regulator n=1 Tax=Chitinophaga vietnamensis TaxID=2593957 RepID=UPI001177B6C3|nr:helix-turn-helix domain-containing protein [Chitinophaga vietnamensis]
MRKEVLEEVLIYAPALCPFALTLNIIGGKWKPLIVHLVSEGVNRFSLLEKHLPGISKKVLATQLRELEQDQLLTRQIFAETPPRVEYSVTPAGVSLMAALKPVYEWGVQHLALCQKKPLAI